MSILEQQSLCQCFVMFCWAVVQNDALSLLILSKREESKYQRPTGAVKHSEVVLTK